MSYRSKRTILDKSVGESRSPKKQSPSVSVPRAANIASMQSPNPAQPSTVKWGPFSPPTLGTSKSLAGISQPITSSTTTKKPSTSTASPALGASKPFGILSRPSMSQSIPMSQKLQLYSVKQSGSLSQPFPSPSQSSMQSNPPAKTSKPFSNLSQSHLDQSQQFTQSTSVGASQQRPAPQTKSAISHMFRTTATSELPHTSSQQEVMLASTKMKPQVARGTSPMGATKPFMLNTPARGDSLPSQTPLGGLPRPPLLSNSGVSPTASKPIMKDKSPVVTHIFKEQLQPSHSKSPTCTQVSEPTPDFGNSPPFSHLEREVELHSEGESSSSQSEDLDMQISNKGTGVKKSKPSKPRRRIVVPDWPATVQFNEMDVVVAIDSEGNHKNEKRSIQPRNVWNEHVFRYVVEFNGTNQPLNKGGSVLVSFLGDIAKKEAFCPVGLKSWHELNKRLKADIVRVVREHFVIPEGEVFDKAILKRTDKAWKHYRYTLKKDYFNEKLTSDQNYSNVPDGITSYNWINLVNYWLSPDGKKFSRIGKEARALQGHVHISGATSFANRRHRLQKKKGKFSELEFYESVYAKEDASFKEGTISRQFLEDAKAKVDENLASSSSKSRVDIENEVFNELMYGNEVPKRPLNYGFGVKQSDVFGVQGLLRKEGRVNNSVMENENIKVLLSSLKNQNEKLEQKNQVLEAKFDEAIRTFKTITSNFGQVLKEVRNGNISTELLDQAEATLDMVNSDQVPKNNVSDGNGKE